MSKENTVTFLDPFVISAYKHLVLATDFRQAFASAMSPEDYQKKKDKLLSEVDRKLLNRPIEDFGKLIVSMQITRGSSVDEIRKRDVLERLQSELGLTVEQASIVFRACIDLHNQIADEYWGFNF